MATRWLARRAIATSLAETDDEVIMTSYRDLGRFYLPLAMTPLIGLSVHPMVTFFLGHSSRALESLAIMPVLYSLTFLFRALGLSFPEVAIATLRDGRQNRAVVKKFALYMALALGGGFSLIAFTPLNVFWFATLSGLSSGVGASGDSALADHGALPCFDCSNRLPACSADRCRCDPAGHPGDSN